MSGNPEFGYLKTEAEYKKWLRSSLRRVWSKHPIKLGLIQELRYKKIMGTRMIFVIDCARCKTPTKLADIEINHTEQAGSFDLSNFGVWVERLLLVDKTKLEALCKSCHGVQTYSERYDTDLEEAKIQKSRVAFSNLPVQEQDKILTQYGITIEKPTKIKRAVAYVNHLRKGNK